MATRDHLQEFVAIDVETATRSPPRICALAGARFVAGRETDTFQSLVQPGGRVRIRFTHIHGLRKHDLSAAPPWPAVWQAFRTFLGTTTLLVAFRAPFDRAALLSMCALHGTAMPRLRFLCAADAAERHTGARTSLSSALAAFGLPFPGRPHDPLADARAAAALLLACC